MPKKNMTIEEVKKAKIQLEKDILKMVKDFESETGVRASYISLGRKRKSENMPVAEEPSKPGPLMNVDVSMELDLVY